MIHKITTNVVFHKVTRKKKLCTTKKFALVGSWLILTFE